MDLRTNLRIEQLLASDPGWAQEVFDFISKNPAFQPYLWLAPLTRNFDEHVDAPKNVFDEVLYQLASSGVRATFAFDQYLRLRAHFRTSFPSLDFQFRVSPGKLRYYTSFINKMTACGLQPNELTYEQFISNDFARDVIGIGQTSLSNIASKYGGDESVFPSTDRAIVHSINKLFGMTKKREIDVLVATWSDHSEVAKGMLFSIYHYARD